MSLSKREAEKRRKLFKKIRDRERRFQKMTPNKKRVAIAKDVIRGLEEETINAKTGVYVDVGELFGFDYGKNDQIRDTILERSTGSELPACTACALGSMFVCSVLRHNKLKYKNTPGFGQYAMHKYLTKWFDIDQLVEIETAFEWGGQGSSEAYQFGCAYDDPGERMQAIMQNIVDNDGTFVPGDLNDG